MGYTILACEWPCTICNRPIPPFLGMIVEECDLRRAYCLVHWRGYIYQTFGIRQPHAWHPVALEREPSWEETA